MRDPDYDKLSEIVFQVLFESGINELPINMVGLCQSRGIKIKYLPDEDMREGCCQVHEGKPYLFCAECGAENISICKEGFIMAVKKKPYRVTVHEIVTENIRLLLASHDEGFKDLCLPLELSQSAVYSKKSGGREWRISELCALATVYRIPIEWFFVKHDLTKEG